MLPISFIDESVELLNNDTPNDLIGKAYLPLRDMLTDNMRSYKLQVKNLKQETVGMVEIQLSLTNKLPFRENNRYNSGVPGDNTMGHEVA